MFVAASNILTLGFTVQLLVAGHFLGHVSTSARSLHQFHALATLSRMASLTASVFATIQELLARVATGSDVLRTSRNRAGFATRTCPRQSHRTLATVPFVTALLTVVQPTGVHFTAYLATLPPRFRTIDFLGFSSAEALLLAPTFARWTVIARMANLATLVNPTVSFLFACLQTGPGSLRTPDGLLGRLATLTRNGYRLRTWWARTRMAQ